MRSLLAPSTFMMLLCLILGTFLVQGAYIIDTDGSADDLLSLVSILEDKPTTTSEKLSTVKLVIVSANGRGVTSSATALQNVRGVLKMAKREDIPVVLGDPLSWADRAATSQDNGGADAATCNDHLHFPKTPFDVLNVHSPTIAAPWSQFDEDTLFGLAKSRLPWQATPTLQQSSSSSSSITVATAAVDAITDAMSSAVLFDRMHYICLGPLTNIANWLSRSAETTTGGSTADTTTTAKALILKAMKEMRGSLNVIMIPKVKPLDGFKLDPLAANYVLTFVASTADGTHTNIIRKVFTSTFTSAVQQYPAQKTTALKTLIADQSVHPAAVQFVISVLAKKETVYEAYDAEKERLSAAHSYTSWESANYGPQTVLAVLASWRSSLLQGEPLPTAMDIKYDVAKGALVENTEASSSTTTGTAIDDVFGSSSSSVAVAAADDDGEVYHEDTRATQVYITPFSHTTTFWTEWQHLLEGKDFMA